MDPSSVPRGDNICQSDIAGNGLFACLWPNPHSLNELADMTIGGATFGLSEFVPEVSGRLPGFGTRAFYTGAHTVQDAVRLGIDTGSNYLSAILSSALSSPSGMDTYQLQGQTSNYSTLKWNANFMYQSPQIK